MVINPSELSQVDDAPSTASLPDRLVAEAYDFLSQRFGSLPNPERIDRLQQPAAVGTLYDLKGNEIDDPPDGSIVFRLSESDAGNQTFEILRARAQSGETVFHEGGRLKVSVTAGEDGALAENRSIEIKIGDSYIQAATGTVFFHPDENGLSISLRSGATDFVASFLNQDVTDMSVTTLDRELKFTFNDGQVEQILINGEPCPDESFDLLSKFAMASREEIRVAHGFPSSEQVYTPLMVASTSVVIDDSQADTFVIGDEKTVIPIPIPITVDGLNGESDQPAVSDKPPAVKAKSDVLPTTLENMQPPLTENERTKLFKDVKSADVVVYSRAINNLRRLGPGLLHPQFRQALMEELRSTDTAEIRKRFQLALYDAVGSFITPFENRMSVLGSDFGKNGLGPDRLEELDRLVAEADSLSSSPEATGNRVSSLTELSMMPNFGMSDFPIPGFQDQVRSAISELAISPATLPVNARMWAARALLSARNSGSDSSQALLLIQNFPNKSETDTANSEPKVRARIFLAEALKLDNNLATDQEFLNLLARADGTKDTELMKLFEAGGGNKKQLQLLEQDKRLSQPLVMSPEQKDLARAVLRNAMQLNPKIVDETDFLRVFAAAIDQRDGDLVQLFQRSGGSFQRLLRAKQPFEQAGTGQAWQSFLGKNSSPGLSLEERRKAIDNAQSPDEKVRLLKDQVMQARAEDSPELAIVLVELENIAKDPKLKDSDAAKAAADTQARFNVFQMASEAQVQLDLYKLPFQEQPGELDKLLASPVGVGDRNNRVINLILRRYDSAPTADHRHVVMELLRDEVQRGNESAVRPLALLSTVDGALRLVQASDVLANPASTPEAQAQARLDQRAALLDLAMLANASRRRGDTNSPAGRILDFLDQKPLLTMASADVGKAKLEAGEVYSGRQKAVAKAFVAVIASSGNDKNATTRITALHRAQIASDIDTSLAPMIDKATFAGTVNNIGQNLYTPEALAGTLAELSRYNRDGGAGDIITRLKTHGKEGSDERKQATELALSIESGDRAKILKSVVHPGARAALFEAMKPQAIRANKLEGLSGVDIEKLVGGEAGEEQLFEQAEKRRQAETLRVDDLVARYLLRDQLGAKLVKQLGEVLPPPGSAIRKSDLSPELIKSLEKGLDLQQFTPDVAHLLTTLLKDGSLTDKQCAELKLSLEQTGDNRRLGAIFELNNLTRNNLHLEGTRFRVTHDRLLAVETAVQIQLNAKQIESSPPDKIDPKSIRDFIDSLEQLQKQSSYSQQASTYVMALEEACGQKLSALIESLKAAKNESPEAFACQVAALRTALPDGQAELDRFRSQRIVRDLTPTSSKEERRLIMERLKEEIEASKDAGRPNATAQDWYSWLVANDALITMSLVSTGGATPEEAKQALDTVIKEANSGNKYASQSLGAILVGGTNDSKAISGWMRNHGTLDGKDMYVPNFQGMPDDLRTELLKSTRAAVKVSAEKGVLTRELAIATSYAHAFKPDAEYLAILKLGLGHKETFNPTFDALFQVMRTEGKDSTDLAKLYVENIHNPRVMEHFDQLNNSALEGSKACMTVLSAITTGSADEHTRELVEERGLWGVVTRRKFTEYKPIAERARKTLESISEHPDRVPMLVDSMLQVDSWAKEFEKGGKVSLVDRNCYLATLGTVAGKLPVGKLPDQVRAVLDYGFKHAFDTHDALISDHKSGGKLTSYENYELSAAIAQKRYSSAIEGFTAFSKHWQESDVKLIQPRHITPQMVDLLRDKCGSIPAAVAKDLANRLLDVAVGRSLYDADLPPDIKNLSVPEIGDRSFRHRLACLHALGALAPHLGETEIKRIKQIGTTKEHPGGFNETGDDVLYLLVGKEKDLIRAECAGVLMRVITEAPSAPPGTNGPREVAFSAFTAVDWPMYSHYHKGQGQGDLKPSHESYDLRVALVQYYKGEPFRLDLAEKIGLIVDGAQLPRPSAALLLDMGIHRGRIADRRPNDPPNVFMIANQIIRHYGKDGANGEKVLRDVARNVELLNSVPAGVRAKVMGWDKWTKEEKEYLGWKETPSAEDQRKINWSQMNDEQKEAIRWQAVVIPPELIARKMYAGTLGETPYSALLDDIPGKINALRKEAQTKVDATTTNIKALETGRSENLSTLVDMTTKGVPYWTKVKNTFNNGVDREWASEQFRLASSFDETREKVKILAPTLKDQQYALTELDLGQRVLGYIEARNQGRTEDSRQIALSMWKNHAVYLAQIAPEIWNDLMVSGDDTVLGRSILKQLKARGKAHWDTVPLYERTYNNDEEAFSSILGKKNCANAKEPRGLIQLKDDGRLEDRAALRAHMFRALHDDPTLTHISGVANDMQQKMEEFRRFFQAAEDGTIYRGGIHVLRSHAKFLKDQMTRVDATQLTTMRTRIKQMEEALSSAVDPGTKEELKHAIKSYQDMHDLLNPVHSQHYDRSECKGKNGEVIKDENDRAVRRNQYKELNTILDDVLQGRVTESSFTNWIKQNGPAILATIAACALAASACATFGLTGPLAIAAIAAVGLMTREATNEYFYSKNLGQHTGWGPTRNNGAKILHFNRQIAKAQYDTPLTDDEIQKSWWKNVGYEYGKEFARDFACFVVGAGLGSFAGSAGAGAKTTFKESFGSVLKANSNNLQHVAVNAERMVMMANGSSGAAACMRQIGSRSFREMIQSVRDLSLETIAEGGLTIAYEHYSGSNLTPGEIQKMGEFGQFMQSFSISLGVNMGMGYRTGRAQARAEKLVDYANLGPGRVLDYRLTRGVKEVDFLKRMQDDGYVLTPTGKGTYHVRQVGGNPDIPPITLNNLARGDGNPPVSISAIALDAPKPNPRTITVDGTSVEVHPEAQKLIGEVRQCLEALQAGKFQDAINIATATNGLPDGVTFKHVPVEVNLADLQGPSAQANLQAYLQKIGAVGSAPHQLSPNTSVDVPQVIINVGGVKIDAITMKVLDGGGQNSGQIDKATAVLKTFMDSAHGRRIATEAVITTIEERAHVRHAGMGNRAVSSLYAEWVLKNQKDSPEHMSSFVDGKLVDRGRVSLEQEILFIFEQAGLSRKNIGELFGHNHLDVRSTVLEFMGLKPNSRISPDFFTSHPAKSMDVLAKAIKDRTSGWSDVSNSAEAADSYFKARSDYEAALLAEGETLAKAGTIGSTKILETMQQRVAKGQASQKLLDMHKALDALRTPDIRMLESRIQDMQAAVDRYCKEVGIPSVKLEFGKIDADGFYKHGHNSITLNYRDLLSPEGAKKLLDNFAHELVHRSQDELIVRALSESEEFTKGNIDLTSKDGMRKLTEKFKDSTGFDLDSDFAAQVLKDYKGKSLSQAQTKRAQDLAASFKRYNEDVDAYDEPMSQLAEVINELQANPAEIDEFRKALDDPDAREFYFGNDDISWLDRAIEQRNKKVITDKELASKIADRMLEQYDSLQRQKNDLYRNTIHEVEAWHISEILKGLDGDNGIAGNGVPAAQNKMPREQQIEINRRAFVTDDHFDLSRRQDMLKRIDDLPANMKVMFGEDVFAGTHQPDVVSVEKCLRAYERFLKFADSDPVTAQTLKGLPHDIRKAIVDPFLERPKAASDAAIRANVTLADNFAKTAKSHPELICSLLSLNTEHLQVLSQFFKTGVPDAATLNSLRGLIDTLHQLPAARAANVAESLASMRPDVLRLLGDQSLAGKMTGPDLVKLLENLNAKTCLTTLGEDALKILQTAMKDKRLTADKILALAETKNGINDVIAIETSVQQGTLKRSPELIKDLYALPSEQFEALAPLVKNKSISEADMKPLMVLSGSSDPQVRRAAAEIGKTGRISDTNSLKQIEMAQSGDPAKVKAVIDIAKSGISDSKVLARILELPAELQSAVAQTKFIFDDPRYNDRYSDEQIATLLMLNASPEFLATVQTVIRSTTDRPVLIERLQRLSDLKTRYVDSGVLPAEAVGKMVTSPRHSDSAVLKILDRQVTLNDSNRLSKETLKKLVDLANTDEISQSTLDVLSHLHARGEIDSKTIARLIDLPPAERENIGLLLNNPDKAFDVLNKSGPAHPTGVRGRLADADMKTLVEGLTADGVNKKQIETVAKEIREKLAAKLKEIWPDDILFKIPKNGDKKLSDEMKNIGEFAAAMGHGDYTNAYEIASRLPEGSNVRISETDQGPASDTRASREIRVETFEVSLADLQNPTKIQALLNRMHTANAQQESTGSDSRYARIVEPVVEIEPGVRVSLMNPDYVLSGTLGEKSHRTTPAQRALVVSIQQSPVGRALRAKTAMVLFEENLVHTNQTVSSGVSKLTLDFRDSDQFKSLKKYWADKAPNIANDKVNEALREIDVAASMIEAGVPRKTVERMFGKLHLEGERQFFYDYLKKKEELAAKPPGSTTTPGGTNP